MQALLQDSVKRVFDEINSGTGKGALATATESDIAVYQGLWIKALAKYSATGAPRMPLELTRRFLAAEVANINAVDSVLEHLGYRASVDPFQFQTAAHVLYSAVRSAQEAVFTSDDPSLWRDAAPATNSKASQGIETQEDWLIGAVAAAHGALDDQNDEVDSNNNLNEEENAAAVSTDLSSCPGPLEEGIRALSGTTSEASTVGGEGAHSPSVTSGGGGGGQVRNSRQVTSSARMTPTGAAETSPCSSASSWKAFDDAFSQLKVSEQAHQSSETPRLSWAPNTQQLSLTEASQRLATTTLPGTGISPMDPLERRRCEDAFASKGYSEIGGVGITEADRIFRKAQLPSSAFHSLWKLVDPSNTGALDSRRFCLFMHLLKAAALGESLPCSLDAAQEAALLGDFAPDSLNSARCHPHPQMHLDTARLRAALHLEPPPPAIGASSVAPGGQHSLAGANISASAYCADDFSDEDSSDAESVASFASSAVPRSARAPLAARLVSTATGTGANNNTNNKNNFTSFNNNGTSNGGASSSRIPSSRIPTLAVPPAVPVSRLDLVAWEQEAGPGHSGLELRLRSAALTQRKVVDRPFVTLSVRDPLGRLVELPQDTHPGMLSNGTAMIDFADQALALATPLRSLPPGCTLFLEMRQWKADKKKLSTVAWTFVEAEMMVDSGPVCSRVRCGPMVLPLFRKPVDPSMRKLKRLNSKGPALYVVVRGLE